MVSRNLIEIFIEPGQMSLFAALDHFKAVQLEGSRSDSDRIRLMRMEDPVERKIQPVMRRYDIVAPLYNAEFKKDQTSGTFKRLKATSDSINAVLDPLYKEGSSIDSAFIVDNPASYFAANMLLRKVSGGSTDQFPDIKKLYDRFSRDIKESSYGQSIYYVMESERKIRIGLDL
jgi:hypothetical protein